MRRQTPTEPMDWERPSEGFLAYLDRLAGACLAHDRGQVEKLMRMRFSSHLPRTILDELELFRRSAAATLRAPLKLMRYVHQMQQLAAAPAPARARTQLPLELRERDVAPPPSESRRRPAGRRSDVKESE